MVQALLDPLQISATLLGQLDREKPTCRFYYWPVGVAQGVPVIDSRKVVDQIVAPIFEDIAARAQVLCMYARKLTPDLGSYSSIMLVERGIGVRLVICCAEDSLPAISTWVARHVPTDIREGPTAAPERDRACWDDCAWYRRALTQVTGIALDLHRSPAFDSLRAMILELHAKGGLRRFTRTALEEVLLRHSPRYRTLDSTNCGEFWHALLRWGPAPNLFPPGHILESLLLPA